ncbi:MAG: L-aspartate oxidase [Cyclobacteriaceae bacterium]
MPKTDVLIIGSGIAGLSVAIKVAQRFPHRQCLIITKQESAESNTRYAQGGIAVVSDFIQDSFEDHITDTLNAGDGLCNYDVVEHVVHQAPARLKELIEMGADFDRDASGDLLLGREGGHRANRIIHFQDVTGLNISTALLEKVKSLPNVRLLSHHVAIDLISEEKTGNDEKSMCHGGYVLNVETGRIEKYTSAITVLATGGIGQLYRTTTNPLIATGDGIAMAIRAGASVSNMEFVQFHPTALYDTQTSPAFLISEAVRGQGAFLRNSAGERFMFNYHIDGELACRDVVSRAIASEILASKENFVYLDCTHIPRETLLNHFPNIYQRCLSKGINITRDYIPVAPAAHYLCGGIDVDIRSRTTVQNLYSCGECANTGLHGANRLASNSLLEAIVFAHNCFEDIERSLDGITIPSSVFEVTTPISKISFDAAGLAETKVTIQTLMNTFVGIVRSTKGLEQVFEELRALENSILADGKGFVLSAPWYELRNMIICARLVVNQSLERKENKGGFYNKNLAFDAVVN